MYGFLVAPADGIAVPMFHVLADQPRNQGLFLKP